MTGAKVAAEQNQQTDITNHNNASETMHYVYDAAHERLIRNDHGTRTARTSATLPTDHGFLGHPEDSSGLVDLGHRSYDPLTTTFTSMDKVADNSGPSVLSPYEYTAGDPINGSDPSGDYTTMFTGGFCRANDISQSECTKLRQDEAARYAAAPVPTSTETNVHWGHSGGTVVRTSDVTTKKCLVCIGRTVHVTEYVSPEQILEDSNGPISELDNAAHGGNGDTPDGKFSPNDLKHLRDHGSSDMLKAAAAAALTNSDWKHWKGKCASCGGPSFGDIVGDIGSGIAAVASNKWVRLGAVITTCVAVEGACGAAMAVNAMFDVKQGADKGGLRGAVTAGLIDYAGYALGYAGPASFVQATDAAASAGMSTLVSSNAAHLIGYGFTAGSGMASSLLLARSEDNG